MKKTKPYSRLSETPEERCHEISGLLAEALLRKRNKPVFPDKKMTKRKSNTRDTRKDLQ